MEILDSGERRHFNSGAVRDVAEGKGRCDLLPLDIVGDIFNGDYIPYCINNYIRTGDISHIRYAIQEFSERHYDTIYESILELSKHYENGAKKYAERNWEKGIPCHCYVDSGVRHYLKFLRGDTDEPHGRAFLWNMYGLIWTHNNLPEMRDLPFAEDYEND